MSAAVVRVLEVADRVGCEVDGCGNLAAPRCSKCWGHLKQLQRHGRTMPLRIRLDARAQLFDAALALQPDSDDDLEAAERRFWDAFRRAARELGPAEALALSPGGRKLRVR